MITIAEQMTEVRRELGMRKHVYPRFIELGKLTQFEADLRIARLEAVLRTLEAVVEYREPQLFGPAR